MRSGGWERSARDAALGAGGRHRRIDPRPRRRASCRSWSRRWSTPASARPRRSASPPSTRPTARSPPASTASPSPEPGAEEDGRGGGAPAPRAGRRCPRGQALPRQRLLDLAPALLGDADPGHPLRELRRRCRCPRPTCRWCCRATSTPTGEGNPLAERPDFVDVDCPHVRRSRPSARPTRSTATSTRSCSGSRPRCRRRTAPSRCSPTPTCAQWLPAERLVAGGDSGGFVFDQRIVTKALRDHGAVRLHRRRRALRRLPLPRDGDRRRAQDEQAPRQRRQPRRAGRAVRRRHGPPRGPLRRRPGEDAELERRRAALRQPLPAQPLDLLARTASRRSRTRRTTPRPRPTPSTCATACANGARTASSGSPRTPRELQMHKAIRNLTRLFERIQDFEKRVVKRRGQLDRADAEAQVAALVLLLPGAGAVRPAHRRGAADRLRPGRARPSCRGPGRTRRRSRSPPEGSRRSPLSRLSSSPKFSRLGKAA